MSNSLGPSPAEDGVRCELCGGRDFRLLHQWPVGNRWNPATIPLAVWRCTGCNLVRLHPVPGPDELPEGGDWWSERRSQFRRRRWFKTRWERLRFALFGDPAVRLVRATRRLVPTGPLLDVGCGRGGLLVEASRYYSCMGLEPSPAAAAAVRARGFPVIVSTFEQAEVPEESFDVLTMDSVIEHLRDPRRVLAKANRLLRPGGVIVLKTPKFDGPAYRRHGGGWNGFRHGYHTFLFTARTLGLALRLAGFHVVRRPRRNRILDDILVLWGRKTAPPTASGEWLCRAEPMAEVAVPTGPRPPHWGAPRGSGSAVRRSRRGPAPRRPAD